MDNTIITQGSFKSTGANKLITIPTGIDWMRVYNYTAADGNTGGNGFEYYWQRGMPNGLGMFWYHPAGDQTVAVDGIAANNGFFYIDSSSVTITTSPNAITDITNAAPCVISSVAHALVTGDIVRLSTCVGALQICSTDFTITRLNANTFSLTNMPAIVAAAAPGATSRVRKVSNDFLYLPSNRTITAIQAANNRITMSVTHNFTIGQVVRIIVPRVTALAFGMTELDGQLATITNIGQADADGYTNTIDIDINCAAYTAFAFPLTADVPFSPAQVVPVGVDVGTARTAAVNELADRIRNGGYTAMNLIAGVQAPAGDTDDYIYWTVGKSFSDSSVSHVLP